MVTGGIERAVRGRPRPTATLAPSRRSASFRFFGWSTRRSSRRTKCEASNPTFWIAHPTLENFHHVLNDGNFLVYFRNSMIVAGGSTLLALIVSIFCGYALSRFPREPLPRTVGAALFCRR